MPKTFVHGAHVGLAKIDISESKTGQRSHQVSVFKHLASSLIERLFDIFLPQSLPSSINSYNVMSPCSCFSNSRDFLIRKLLAEIIFFNLSILRHSSALLSPDYPSSLEAPQGWVENSHAGHPHDCSWVMEAPA